MYLTVNEIAAELQVSVRTAYEYARQMTRLVGGRTVRVSRASFEAWKRKHTLEPCETSSSERGRTEQTVRAGGRTSTAGASRRAARTSALPRRGDAARNDREPIHITQPRKERA